MRFYFFKSHLSGFKVYFWHLVIGSASIYTFKIYTIKRQGCELFSNDEIRDWEMRMNPRQVVGQIQAELHPKHVHTCPNCRQVNAKVSLHTHSVGNVYEFRRESISMMVDLENFVSGYLLLALCLNLNIQWTCIGHIA